MQRELCILYIIFYAVVERIDIKNQDIWFDLPAQKI